MTGFCFYGCKKDVMAITSFKAQTTKIDNYMGGSKSYFKDSNIYLKLLSFVSYLCTIKMMHK